MRLVLTCWWIFCCMAICANKLQAQTYTPVAVSGYNHDVFADAFPNTQTCTDTVLDATFHIMYNSSFAAAAGLSGGLPNTGLLTDAGNTRQYQLANYAGPNAFTAMRGVTKSMDLVSPAAYSKLSLLCFSTEGASTISVAVKFTDGSATTYVPSYSLADWFNSSTNVVVSGFGRCQRNVSAPYNVDGYPTNPRFYYLDMNLNCADQKKTVQSIIVSNISTSGSAPFPNAVFLALSGYAYSQTITSSNTAATCSSADGSASISISGSTGPYSVSWNTTPTQNGTTASNIIAGSYTATITDASSCATNFNVTVPQQASPVTATATASPAAVCNGGSSQLTVTATGGTLSSYSWTPGSLSGSSVTVSPAGTTSYTVSGQDQFGCTYTQSVTVTVNNPPAAPVINGTQICQGAQASLSVQNPQPGEVYQWYTASSGGSSIATGTNFQTPALTSTTTYYVEATSAAGCVNATRTSVTITVNNPPAAPAASNVSICPGTTATLAVQNPQAGFSYNWFNATSGGSSIFTGNSFQTPVLNSNTTYYIDAVTAQGCTSSTRTAVTVSMLQALPKPVVTVSGITSSSITFSWTAVPGAAGYEVTTDGGAHFHAPSSGASGTSHTITGLTPGQNVTIQVRALGPQACENSVLSDPISAFVPDKNLFVPNVFTPNGDGKNDVLLVFSNSIKTMDFRIFNQWGQEIFASVDPSIGWDGRFKGKQQPVGVYVYVLKVVLTDGTSISKKGSVSLIR